MSSDPTARLAAELAARSDAELATLLSRRPDLISPPAPSFAALAARAGGRASVELALAGLPTPTLAVAQALALGPSPSFAGQSQDSPGAAAAGTPAVEEAAEPGSNAASTPATSASLHTQALMEATGLSAVQVEEELARLAALALAPQGEPLPILATIFHSEPVLSPVPPAPSAADLDTQPADAAIATAAQKAEEIVRLVVALLEEWEREGAPILRSGGVGVRALARTAQALELEPTTAATVIEIAAAAGLLGLSDDGDAWVPSAEAEDFLAIDTAQRWALLAEVWSRTMRTPWLVGTRADDGVLRPVLGEDVEAGWARGLRARTLALLSALPEGVVATPAWVEAVLTYERPRRPAPEGAVAAILAEWELLGLTGGGSPSPAVAALSRGSSSERKEPASQAGEPRESRAGDQATVLQALEAALSSMLPPTVDMLLVQSDLTAIVPGRPSPGLAELMERSSEVESRGGALTVRLTAESVRRALDSGLGSRELLEALARYSPSPLPATLEALIEDAQRHHGQIRVREIRSLLRIADLAVAAELLADKRLAELALSEVAPGVLVSAAPAGQVLRLLRSAGFAPVMEDESGHLVLAGDSGRRRRQPAPESAQPGAPEVRRRRPQPRDLLALISRMRASGDDALGGAEDPVHVLAMLRQARAKRSPLWLTIVGPDGARQERRVRVMALEAGRVRLADLARETELTVAVHRIAAARSE